MDSIFMYEGTGTNPVRNQTPRPSRRREAPSSRGAGGRSAATVDFFLLEGARREGYRRILPQAESPKARSEAPARRQPKGRVPRAGAAAVAAPALLARLGGAALGLRAGLLAFRGSLAGLSSRLGALGGARSLRFRIALGTGLLVLLAGLGALGIPTLLGPRFPLPEGGIAKEVPGLGLREELLAFVSPQAGDEVTETSLPPLPQSLATAGYRVQKGDTLGGIAARFGIDVGTLVSMNRISSAKGLPVGQELKVPNMRGIVHVVRKGESLASIAAANGLSVAAIADANDLGSGILVPGQAVFLPGARLSADELKQIYGETTIWPVRGIISSYFGYRPDPFTGVRRFHGGLDIAIPQGTPVKAAMDGRVAAVGYNQEFGNYVIINHAKGLQTLYGHLSKQNVAMGQAIAQGQVLGLSGNTGYSTAPHLHFGVYKGGSSVNPLTYLK